MSGKFKGVQACITKIYPTVLYVNCVLHSLNLDLSNNINVVPIRNSFGVVEKVYTFYNIPTKTSNYLKKSNSTFSS
jgi:hypothetical protein